jgi:hypothetical protein
MIAIPVVGIGEITGLRGCSDRQPFPVNLRLCFVPAP